MPKRFLGLVLLLICFISGLQAAELIEGMSKEQVIEVLGKPTSILNKGDRTLLLYPNSGRVELVNGKAISFTNLQAPRSTDEAGAAKSPTKKTTGAKPTQASEDNQRSASSVDKSPAEISLQQQQDEKAAALAAASDAIEKLSQSNSQQATLAALQKAQSHGVNFWLELFVQCLVRLPVTVIILKMAFKWAEVHADWGQMWLPALADTLTRAALASLAMQLWHANQLFFIDEGIAYFALLITLMRTTHACTLPRAIAVTMAAKLASFVVWILLSVAILNLLS